MINKKLFYVCFLASTSKGKETAESSTGNFYKVMCKNILFSKLAQSSLGFMMALQNDARQYPRQLLLILHFDILESYIPTLD